jgi:D-glycerate 3-kinase
MVAELADAVIGRLRTRRGRGPLFVGLSGLPGSGKSTLARQLGDALARRGHSSLILALDDFYLGRRDRSRLARDVHPLFSRLCRHARHRAPVRSARRAAWSRPNQAAAIRLPAWSPPAAQPLATPQGRPDVDPGGLAVGVLLLRRANAPRAQCPSCAIRRTLASCGQRRARLRLRAPGGLDLLVALLAPDLEALRRWRAGVRWHGARVRGMSPRTRRFLEQYERWAEHALRVLPGRAGLSWRLTGAASPSGVLQLVLCWYTAVSCQPWPPSRASLRRMRLA